MLINISMAVEFLRWWVLKSKTFGQKSIYSKENIVHILRIQGAPVGQKLGMILGKNVVQILKLEKNVFP